MNPFEQWFSQMPPMTNPAELEEAAKREAQSFAQSMFLVHSSFIKAGFTVDQAFDLTKIYLTSAVNHLAALSGM